MKEILGYAVVRYELVSKKFIAAYQHRREFRLDRDAFTPKTEMAFKSWLQSD
ncbi:MAG: hypothetical protein K1X54_14370 [Flavobacteriales bacterium]|nr:hypothetical protein [Flavobacteriales bacterium]